MTDAKSRYPGGARDQAVAALLAHLAQGRWRPGAVLDASELARELGMSASPMREALTLLLGARILAANHRSGFSLPRLMPYELAEEYRLLGAIADHLLRNANDVLEAALPVSEAPALERFLLSLASRTGPLAATPVLMATSRRLGCYLRAEPQVVSDCDTEMRAIADMLAANRCRDARLALRRALGRRAAHAEAICRHAEAAPRSAGLMG